MKTLPAVSALPLILSVIGLRKSLREGLPFDLRFLKGSHGDLGRDKWLMGTAFSPPIPVLIVQGSAVVWMFLRPGRAAARVLGSVGLNFTIFSLAERSVRESFRHPNRSTTPLVASATAAAAMMAWLGFKEGRRQGSTAARR